MNQDLGLRILGQIMNWTDARARQEFDWLKLMAGLKYDGYNAFQAGMRFIESLVTWLQQFNLHEREIAYTFVRQTLVYIGSLEIQRLVDQFYPRTVRDRLIRMVAADYALQPFQVFADPEASLAVDHLRRQTLFMGLSDGARIDTIRHANSGVLSNEQFVQVTQIDTGKWRALLQDLRGDLEESDARFRLVYLIDDFAGTGTSFLRYDRCDQKWKGKFSRFMKSVEIANRDLGADRLFDDNWELSVHHYVASSAAAKAIRAGLQSSTPVLHEGNATVDASFGMTLPADLPISSDDSRYSDFVRLTAHYYDPIIRTRHTDIGLVRHLGLGYGGCALPLVFEHNTPNNAVALLWAETDGGIREGTRAPAMRALFPRRHRHA